MTADTAKGAKKKNTRTITFKNREHRDLYKECLHEGWRISGSAGIIQMAFNLYYNRTPNIDDSEDVEEQLKECRCYTVEDLSCGGLCKLLLGGCEAPLSGILFLYGSGGSIC